MEELGINFNRNEDPALFGRLTYSDAVIVSEDIKEVYESFKTFKEAIENKQEISKETFESFESKIESILEKFNLKAVLEDDEVDRVRTRERVGRQNALLTEELASESTNENFREKIKNITESLQNWWRIEGTGFVNHVEFESNVISMSLYGHIMDGKDKEGKRLTEKEKTSLFKELGFDINERNTLLLTEKNIELISNIVKEKFPRAYIEKVESYVGRKNKASIRDIIVKIPYVDFPELEPQKSEEASGIIVPFGMEDKTDEEKFKKFTSDISLSLSTLTSQYNDNTLNRGFTKTLVSLILTYSVDLLEVFNYQGKLFKLREEKFIEIRALHAENRNLRRQIGNKISFKELDERIKLIRETLDKWWNLEKLGSYCYTYFYDHGLRVKVSGYISDNSFDEEYIEIDERMKILVSKGWDINHKSQHISDTTNNREKLKNLVRDKFPTSRFIKLESDFENINDIEFIISNFDEITFS